MCIYTLLCLLSISWEDLSVVTVDLVICNRPIYAGYLVTMVYTYYGRYGIYIYVYLFPMIDHSIVVMVAIDIHIIPTYWSSNPTV